MPPPLVPTERTLSPRRPHRLNEEWISPSAERLASPLGMAAAGAGGLSGEGSAQTTLRSPREAPLAGAALEAFGGGPLDRIQSGFPGPVGGGAVGSRTPPPRREPPPRVGELATFNEQEALLRDVLLGLGNMTREQVYDSIAETEKALIFQQNTHEDAEGTVRKELSRLRTEVDALRYQARAAQSRTENGLLARSTTVDLEAETNRVRKQLHGVQRALRATDFYLESARGQQGELQAAREERDKLERISHTKKLAWQEAMDLLNANAAKVDEAKGWWDRLSEAEQARKLDGRKKEQGKNRARQEYEKLIDVRDSFLRQLEDGRYMVEFSRLLEDERRDVGPRQQSAGQILDQVASIEERTDMVERRGQQSVAELRDALVRGSEREVDLQRANEAAAMRLQTLWSTILKQRRERLDLHNLQKDEDLAAVGLQKKTETLIQQLQNFETKSQQEDLGLYDEGGNLLPGEEEQEEEMMADLQMLRGQRRKWQHKLAHYLSARGPLQQVLVNSMAQQKYMQAKLQPLQGFLNASS